MSNRGNRLPGESLDIVVIDGEASFDENFDGYFIKELNKSNFPIVGFNMKWDVTMSTAKQRNKNAKNKLKQQNIKARYDNFSWNNHNGNEYNGDDCEDDEIRWTRAAKAAYGRIALVTLSTLSGLTVQIRTCMFQTFPEKLKSFLESGNYFKIGFGLRKDMYRLWEEQKCQLLSWVDMRHLLMDWKEFRHLYHFRRMGTYSVASYLFGMDLQNKCAAACADWYNVQLLREQIESTAEQTQMDVDILAQYMISRYKLRDDADGGRSLTIHDPLPSTGGVDEVIKLMNEHRNKAWEKTKYNFSEMPVIRKAFDDSERKRLPPGEWVRARIMDDMATNVQKLFGSQPYLGVNLNATSAMPMKLESEFISEDGRFVLTMELEEVKDLTTPGASSTNTSEKEILRKNYRRPSFEKALQKVTGVGCASTSTVVDMIHLAKQRRARRAAGVGVKRDDDIDDQGDFDMADLNLSDNDDVVDESNTSPYNGYSGSTPSNPCERRATIREKLENIVWTPPPMMVQNNNERAALKLSLAAAERLEPGVVAPVQKTGTTFDYNNPQFVLLPSPPTAATAAPKNVRMLRPAIFGAISTSPPPPPQQPSIPMGRFHRVPPPFIGKNGQPLSSMPATILSYSGPISAPTPSVSVSDRQPPQPMPFVEKSFKQINSSSISSADRPPAMAKNPINSIQFVKGRGKMLEALQLGK